MNKREIEAIVKGAGGSTLTKKNRSTSLHAAAKTLRQELNIQLKSFAGLKSQHIERLAAHWMAKELSPRTVQNRMAHLRAALHHHKRESFASSPRVSNGSLGLKSTRGGTHTTPSLQTIQERIAALPAGHKEAAQLQVTLGLRANEAIQSNKSLKTWEKQLENGRSVSVLHGTKGGRQRDVTLNDKNAREAALSAVRAAIKESDSQGGTLVPSKSLQGANRAYQRSMNQVGFKGSEASHSLRYAFAQKQFRSYQEQGYETKEALSALSLDLGHGDGRGTYCKQVYLKGSWGMGASPHGDNSTSSETGYDAEQCL